MTQTQTHFHTGPQDYPILDWSNYRVRATAHDSSVWPPASGDIKSILIIKLDGYGDYMLHTPFYAHLRKFYPQAQITLLCNKINLVLAEPNPAFDHVLAPPFEPGYDQSQSFLYAMELQAHAAASFDLIIVPRWTEDWHHAGVIAQTLDATYRLSFAGDTLPYKAQNFPQHDDFFTHVIDDKRPIHEVWRGMQVLHALGMPMPPVEEIKQEFHFMLDDEVKIQNILFEKNHPRPWFVFGIGGSGDFKRWPAQHFSELAQKLHAQHGGTVFIIGYGKKDESVAAIISAQNPAAQNYVGKLSARENGVLIRTCDIIISNDSFAIHAAATVGTPVVEVVGHPADGDPESEYLPWRFGPWGIPFAWVHPLSCHTATHKSEDFREDQKCIADVPPDDILATVTEGLRRWPSKSRCLDL